MKLIPLNNQILVKKHFEQNKNQYIPEGLEIKEKFTVCSVLEDSENYFFPDSLIVVRTEGLEEVSFKQQNYLIVGHGFVVGELSEDD